MVLTWLINKISDALQKFFNTVESLWDDAGVQTCYDRSNEYQLIDCAK